MRSRAYAAEAKVADLSRQLDALRAEKLEASAAGLRRLLADSQAKVADLEARAARYENAQCVTCGLREAP
jgi:uncharacterized membrane protein